MGGLVVVTPKLDALLIDLRKSHDPAARQGMPAHATVLYPFADPGELRPQARRRLAAAVAGVTAFELSFRRMDRFPEVLWLAPEPEAPLVALTQSLAAAFPQFPPYGGRFERVIPHVTVAQAAEPVLDEVAGELARRLAEPVIERVSRVSLFTTTQSRWVEAERFALG